MDSARPVPPPSCQQEVLENQRPNDVRVTSTASPLPPGQLLLLLQYPTIVPTPQPNPVQPSQTSLHTPSHVIPPETSTVPSRQTSGGSKVSGNVLAGRGGLVWPGEGSWESMVGCRLGGVNGRAPEGRRRAWESGWVLRQWEFAAVAICVRRSGQGILGTEK